MPRHNSFVWFFAPYLSLSWVLCHRYGTDQYCVASLLANILQAHQLGTALVRGASGACALSRAMLSHLHGDLTIHDNGS